MLNKAKPKRLKCKGYDLRSRILNLDTKYSGVGKALCNGIPVLSIFALLGIMSISTVLPAIPKEQQLSLLNPISWLGLPSLLSTSLDSAYADTYTATSGESSVSLTIGGAGEAEQVSAGRGVVAYRSHTVRVKADVVKDYGLTISGPANLTAPSGGTTISGVSNKTGSEMNGSSTYDNTWGYGWGATTTSDSGLVYRTLSTTGTNLLTVNGTSDKPALSNRAVDFTRKLVFAVKFGEEAVAGRYYANVTLSLTATPATLTTYSVTYDCKGGTGCPTNYSESLYDESKSYTIPTTAPTRSGYEFLGYSTTDGTTADADYAAGKTITLTQASPSRKLYAIWEAAGPSVTGFGGIKKMQDMTPSVCKGVSSNTTGQLYDTRDNKVYSVKKLYSGQCWMMSNLRLTAEGLTANGHSTTLKASDNDTDLVAGIANFDLPASMTTNAYIDSNTAAVLNSTYYGYTYYSWTAATAGTGTTSITSGDASSSICPKGWYLPKSGLGSTNDFALAMGYNVALTDDDTEIASTATRVGDIGWDLAGSSGGSYGFMQIMNMGTHGRYWSRTSKNSSQVYALIIPSPYIYPAQAVGKSNNGYIMRCVAYSS